MDEAAEEIPGRARGAHRTWAFGLWEAASRKSWKKFQQGSDLAGLWGAWQSGRMAGRPCSEMAMGAGWPGGRGDGQGTGGGQGAGEGKASRELHTLRVSQVQNPAQPRVQLCSPPPPHRASPAPPAPQSLSGASPPHRLCRPHPGRALSISCFYVVVVSDELPFTEIKFSSYSAF